MPTSLLVGALASYGVGHANPSLKGVECAVAVNGRIDDRTREHLPRRPDLRPAAGRHRDALRPVVTMRGRLAVAARMLLAILGGYILAALATAGLALTLPMGRPEAVTTATLLSFAIYACAVVWVFAARRLTSACAGLAVPALALGGLVWLMRGTAGG